MKTLKQTITLMVNLFIAVFFLMTYTGFAQEKVKPWPVPEKDKSLTPPASIKLTDVGVIAKGKELWEKHCKSCHGSKGLGDGIRAASLKSNVPDFSTAAFQVSTNGEIFYRIQKGRDDMPGYENSIPETSERWALVAFIRSVKK